MSENMRRWLWLISVMIIVGLGAYGLRVLLGLQEPERQLEAEALPHQLLVQAHIIDEETGLPVRATVYLNGIKTLENVGHFTIVVPPLAEGFVIEVRADGYKPWGMRFRYKLKQGYLFKGPIQLKRSR